MEQHIPDAAAEDYDALVDQLNLPDDGHRHILAAAIKGDAEILVTANLRHFRRRRWFHTALRRFIPMNSCCD